MVRLAANVPAHEGGGEAHRDSVTARAIRAVVTSDRFDGLIVPLLCGGSAISIGYALELDNGAYGPEPLKYLTVGLFALVAAAMLPRVARTRRSGVTPIAGLLGLGVALQTALLVGMPPGIYVRTPFWSGHDVQFSLALVALLVGIAICAGRTAQRVIPAILMAIHLTLAWRTLEASRSPFIDVFAWHFEAFKALALRHNPYAITMPNIYGSAHWYGAGLARGGRILVGYPYPPLSLILGWVGDRFGDYRLSNMASTALAGAFMAYARPGRLATVAASIFWFSPRILFVLEQGWTEPQVVLFVAATVFVACRAPRLIAVPLGLLLGIKQYAIFAVPFVFMLQDRPSVRQRVRLVVEALLIAAIIVVPWVLWNARAFFDSVVAFQGKQPFRPDALSYLAWSASHHAGLPMFPLSMSFFVLVPSALIALVRIPRTPSGFATAFALVLAIFFAFAKQAFCNYYMMVIGTLCCAAASARTTLCRAGNPDTREPL